MTSEDRKRTILAAGRRLGFRDARVARIEPLDREAFYEAWLADGRAGDMRFLLHHKKARLDPRTRYPWARAIVSAFFPYDAPPPPLVSWRTELRGRIASYAFGPDYHDVLGNQLERWCQAAQSEIPGLRVRAFVDTGAVFEHEWAARAGVGWTGKHTLTLSESRGSYAFLAELLVGAELDPDPPVPDRCGTCHRCIDACPTQAIEKAFLLDPRRCLSYLTIEHRGVIPPEMRPALGEWIFGCDLCQMACPWNDRATGASRDVLAPSLAQVLSLDRAAFDRLYGQSAVRRTGRRGLARNAAVVLGNTGNPEAVAPLAAALATHDEPLVRAHVADALARLHSVAPREAHAALARGRRDPDAGIRERVTALLEKR